jgi:hypothetical protein
MDPDPIRILIRSTELHCTIPHIQLSLFKFNDDVSVGLFLFWLLHGRQSLYRSITRKYQLESTRYIHYRVWQVKGMIKTHEYLKV